MKYSAVDQYIQNAASFKEHCAFNFWKAPQTNDPYGLPGDKEERAWDILGKSVPWMIFRQLISCLPVYSRALEVFEKFPFSHKKEYIMWISEAKTLATRLKRVETTVEWSAEGKGRNRKYG